MATLADISQKLLPDQFFHLFNRGINGQTIFFRSKNYSYFLRKYATYTQSYLDTYAYCLIPNHFHFLVKVKSTEAILLAAQKDYLFVPKGLQKEILEPLGDLPNLKDLADLKDPLIKNQAAAWLVSNQLRKLFLAYAKAINKQEVRTGSLMQKPFRRKFVDNDTYLKWLIWYIHRNPMHHDLSKDFRDYKHSSYHSHLSNQSTLLLRDQVLEYFHGKTGYLEFHNNAERDWDEWQKYLIE